MADRVPATISPAGYNLRAGGGNEVHNPASVAKRAQSLRKNKDECDLPYHTKREVDPTGHECWRINNHPLCSSASFRSKDAMLAYLAKLESGEIVPIMANGRTSKTDHQHIYECTHGYVVIYNKKMLVIFSDKTRPKDQLLALTITRVQELKVEGIIN